MGILKHAVLPFFTVVHVIFLSFYVRDDLEGLIKTLEWPRSELVELTAVERHGFGAGIGAGMMVLLFAGLVGIFQEDSHFRGLVGLMHLLFYVNDTYDNWKIEGMDPTGAGVFALIALVGVVSHALEPGFFTKDKEANKKKS